jgi:NAD(P)-dependent dehydrogenase (short-subunit alcohol dehydrogenase family)
MRTAQGRLVPAAETAWMRAREVWVHAVDLDTGARFGDFPDVLLDSLMDDIVGTWRRNGHGAGMVLAIDGRASIAVQENTPVDATIHGPLPAVVRWAAGRGAIALTTAPKEPATLALSLKPWMAIFVFLLTAYSTNKAAVFMFSDCLRAELAKSGISVTTICPGIVHTNIIANTEFSGVSARTEDDKQQKFDRLYEKRHYTPDKVAERIVAAVAKKKSIVPVTPEAHVAYHARRFVPALGRWLAARKDIIQ